MLLNYPSENRVERLTFINSLNDNVHQNCKEIHLGCINGHNIYCYPFNQPGLRFQSAKYGIMEEFERNLLDLMFKLKNRIEKEVETEKLDSDKICKLMEFDEFCKQKSVIVLFETDTLKLIHMPFVPAFNLQFQIIKNDNNVSFCVACSDTVESVLFNFESYLMQGIVE